MKWMTHQCMAIMAAVALGMPAAGIAGAWAGSVFPDMLDRKKAGASFFRQAKFNSIHRKGSHWFGWWLFIWLFSFAELLGPLPDTALRGFAFGALTHVFLDMCTVRGVPVFPAPGKNFSLGICRTGGIGEYAILALSVILFWLAISGGSGFLELPAFLKCTLGQGQF